MYFNTLGEELKAPSPLPIPIIAPPTVVEPSPMDKVVSDMATVRLDASPPPKKVCENYKQFGFSLCCVYNNVSK